MKRPKDKLLKVVAISILTNVPKVIFSPFHLISYPIGLASDFLLSAPRGFCVPKLISDASATAAFAVAALGVCDLALDIGSKGVTGRECLTCNGWDALQCTVCKGTGRVKYRVKNYTLRRGEKATAECIADAITDKRAQLEYFPAVMDLNIPLPSKDCPTCDGSGVMGCPGCKQKFPLRISADDIMEPPWPAHNIMRKMHSPYERIIYSMKDPSIAAFWLITMPQIVGGFEYDDDVKQKLWWQYKENMRYDQLRGAVAERKPGWEQEALISIDPVRARDDPVVVRNIPYRRAKYALETEVMKLEPPPRPQNWGLEELNLPLDASFWSEVDLKDPKKMNEMKVLLEAQREITDKILDSQWEKKWRQEKLSEMLEEKVKPYIQDLENDVLPQPIIMPKAKKKRRWWLF